MSTRFIDTGPITPTAGFPYRGVTLDHFFFGDNETTNAFCANMIGPTYIFSNDYIISGCINSTPAGPAFTISAGYIFHLGALFIVDATTLTPAMGQTAVCVVDITYNTLADPTIFTDGSSHSVHVIRKIKIQSGVSGSGFSDFVDLIRTGIDRRIYVGSAGNPTFLNGWTNNGCMTCADLSFRRNYSTNRLYIDGSIDRLAWDGSSNPEIFRLPIDYRPNKAQSFPVICSTTINTIGFITCNPDGFVTGTILNPIGVSNTNMIISGVNFFIDI